MKLQASGNNGGNPNPETDSKNPQNPNIDEDFDSTCSTPYVSAPSSPGRGAGGYGFFYSAPASPMHFAVASFSSSMAATTQTSSPDDSVPLGFEFEFSARFGASGPGETGSMISADELFLNGQIRSMKLWTHLERAQGPAPSLHPEQERKGGGMGEERGRDLRFRDKSLRRRTRSLSPIRNLPDFGLISLEDPNGCSERESSKKIDGTSEEICNYGSETSGSSSRSSSTGRSSKRWVFLKDFLRSKSEGRSNNKFWSNISFHPITTKEKKQDSPPPSENHKGSRKSVNGVTKRRLPPSAHELHYTASRAQAEGLRKRTFLPYRQGLLGCLGFSSKGYGAMSGFARALNPVSSG